MNDIIYCCVMTDRSEFKDASPELLSALGYDFSSWKDEETKEIKHTLYFSNEKDSVDAMNTLMAKEEEFNSFGIRFTDFSCTKLKKEDWAEVWKIPETRTGSDQTGPRHEFRDRAACDDEIVSCLD